MQSPLVVYMAKTVSRGPGRTVTNRRLRGPLAENSQPKREGQCLPCIGLTNAVRTGRYRSE